jgi:hypothetical protein
MHYDKDLRLPPYEIFARYSSKWLLGVENEGFSHWQFLAILQLP